VQINERDFFKNPFNRVEIEDLLRDKAASEMFNFRSPSFAKLGLDRDKLTNDELIELMLKEPRLVRRPVVRIDGSVYFGADVKALKSLID
jgi:arsenate reductase-like glutaredoxin family protein